MKKDSGVIYFQTTSEKKHLLILSFLQEISVRKKIIKDFGAVPPHSTWAIGLKTHITFFPLLKNFKRATDYFEGIFHMANFSYKEIEGPITMGVIPANKVADETRKYFKAIFGLDREVTNAELLKTQFEWVRDFL